MAHVYTQKAGQYAKRRAKSLMYRYLGILITSLGIGNLCLGLILAPFVFKYLTPWLWVVAIGGVAASFWSIHRLDKISERSARDRIKWLRGGQTEALVFWHLRDLPKEWHVFNNVQLEDARDLDHVLVGPNGVFALSTKSMKGLLSQASDGRHLHNNKPTNLLKDALQQTMAFKKRLDAVMGEDSPFVNACLVVPFMFIDQQGKMGQVYAINEDGLDLFENVDTGAKLGPKHVERIAAAVEMLAKSNRRVFRDCPVEVDG